MTAVQSLVDLRDIRVNFGAVQALSGATFELLPGEVHALLGQNGAGKSTLIKVLSGVNQHDAGQVIVRGEETRFRSAQDSRTVGIAMVYQELSLVSSMSVSANLFLGREPRTARGIVSKRELDRLAQSYLDSQGFPVDAEATVGDLPFAYRQLTEIAKALMGDVKILVLDEPTSALSIGEEEILFNAVSEVRARGVGVVYVTHRLQEVFRISDRVTVLRDGQNVVTVRTADVSMEEIVSAIVGADHKRMADATLSAEEGDRPTNFADHGHISSNAASVIELRDVHAPRVNGISLRVRPGEILGLAGMVGSGRTEIAEVMFGLRHATSGDVIFQGAPVRWRNSGEAISAGVALVPEDRHVEGLVLAESIAFNIALPSLPWFSKFGWFDGRRALARVTSAFNDLNVKAPGVSTRLQDLSGGNQQKVVFGKWLEPQPKLLLLDEPTVGVDVGARDEIYGIIRRFARQGVGIIVISSDLVELQMLCDTIAVVSHGRIPTVVTQSEIGSEGDLHHLVQEAGAQ